MSLLKSEVDRLKEIQEEMSELLDEAKRLVQQSGDRFQIDRMKAYWHPHIQMALSDDHMYLGKDGATMQDCIESLESDCEDENECVEKELDGGRTAKFFLNDGEILITASNGEECSWVPREDEYAAVKAEHFPNEEIRE
jgi:hypothetical protein